MFRAYYSGIMYKASSSRAEMQLVDRHAASGWSLGAALSTTPFKLVRSCFAASTPHPQAILAATQRSFSAIKRRVGSHASTGIFFLERPFFDVQVELKVCVPAASSAACC